MHHQVSYDIYIIINMKVLCGFETELYYNYNNLTYQHNPLISRKYEFNQENFYLHWLASQLANAHDVLNLPICYM